MEVYNMYTTKTGEFKGNKTISIFKDEKHVISFGAGKATAILESLEEIKKFLEDCKKDNEKLKETELL